MNGRRLCNLHQRYKFLRAKASRDILKIRVSEMAFPHHFVLSENTCKTGNNALLLKCPRRSTTFHGSNVPQI